MSPQQLFSLLNLAAMAGWLLLALIDVAGRGFPLLLAVVYVVTIATHWRGSEGGFSSLADVATLFANPWLLLAGWTHYLAFDLFVGGWEARDARERRISHLLVLPCLLLTFLFGPAGLLLYFGMRTGLARA
jgi:ABA4-like protein